MGFEAALLLLPRRLNFSSSSENDSALRQKQELSDYEVDLYHYTSVIQEDVLPTINIVCVVLDIFCFFIYVSSPSLRRVPCFHYIYLLALSSILFCSVELLVHFNLGDFDQLDSSLQACRTVFYLQNVAVLAAIFCLVWFTVARSCAILYPFLDVHNPAKVYTIRASIFLLPAIYFSYIFVVYNLNELGYCETAPRYRHTHFVLHVLELIFLAIVPAVVITTLNLLLVLKLLRPDDAITFINSYKSSSSAGVSGVLTLVSFVALLCILPNIFVNAVYALSNIYSRWYLRYGTIVVLSRYSAVLLNMQMALQVTVFSLIIPEFRQECVRILRLKAICRCFRACCCCRMQQQQRRFVERPTATILYVNNPLTIDDDLTSYYFSNSNQNL